jgi:hypothetical protein
LPEDFPLGELPFVVSTPDGDTNTNVLQVVDRTLLLDEKEPNGGFRKFNPVKIPQTIRGTIEPGNDVDVFQFPGKAGLRVRIESLSARYGSSLDPIVTLYDAKGHTLSTSDDTNGSTDALLQYSLPKDGNYFLTIMDAHDRGGSIYSYALVIRAVQ